MMVTHLPLEADFRQAAVHVLSILRLPQAVDCGGGLVNVWDLSCLGVDVFFFSNLWPKPEWAHLFVSQQVLG